MAMFHDIRLPEHIERGAEGGPRFKTSVIILSSGKEQRNVEWQRARCEWDIGYSVQTQEQYFEVLQFFYNRRGRAYGFRFKDWSDFKATNSPIGEINVTEVSDPGGIKTFETLQFQLVKRYEDYGEPYNRQITKPVNGTAIVKVNNIIVAATVNYATGMVTIPSSQTYNDGDVITASFEFDVPVRFDVDNLDVTLEWIEMADISGITIVELK